MRLIKKLFFFAVAMAAALSVRCIAATEIASSVDSSKSNSVVPNQHIYDMCGDKQLTVEQRKALDMKLEEIKMKTGIDLNFFICYRNDRSLDEIRKFCFDSCNKIGPYGGVKKVAIFISFGEKGDYCTGIFDPKVVKISTPATLPKEFKNKWALLKQAGDQTLASRVLAAIEVVSERLPLKSQTQP